MKNKPLAWATSSDRPFQGGDHHLMVQRAAQRPADHHPGKQIYDHRQIQPPTAGGQVRIRVLTVSGSKITDAPSIEKAVEKIFEAVLKILNEKESSAA
jgi:hypothetical protein